jgi:hypothetical protein
VRKKLIENKPFEEIKLKSNLHLTRNNMVENNTDKLIA